MSDAFLMKGKVYGEHKHKLVYPVYAEIKYDEIRCHVKRTECPASGDGVEFLAYSGKPLHNLNSWAPLFLTFMVEHGVNNLDMGVLVNGNFNDSYRWCRSSSGFPTEKMDKKTGKVAPALDASMVQFYLFDVPDSALPFETDTDPVDQLDRRAIRNRYAEEMREHNIPVQQPRGYTVHSAAGMDTLFRMVREDGYEGLMVKTWDHTYQPGKRIDGWLKMKPEETADGKIVTVLQAVSIHGEPLGRAGSVYVQLEDGSVACPAGIPHELGALMWANPEEYIGQWVEFKYMERDRAGGYRHPSLVRLREPK